MTGIFFATPSEKCTRYWVLSGFSIGTGILITVLNGGAPRPALLIIGNSILILGVVLQWSGIRAFYKKPLGYAGWIIAAIFFVVYCALLLQEAPARHRVILLSAVMLSLLILYFHEIWTSQKRHTFASMLSLGAVVLLGIDYVFRFSIMAFKYAVSLPTTNSLLSITLTYLIPTAGTMLLSFGLLLLYFERIVADKHHLATHDDLTGLFNRRAIVAAGEREVSVALRMKRPLAVAFVDIDFFKQINDKHGHHTGDRVLVEVAQVLTRTCRGIDLAGRYGGEEFCIILPGMEQDDLPVVGERLVSAVCHHNFPDAGSVTISIGLATLAADERECSWAGLIRKADAELYKAKAAGRNCYSMAAVNRQDLAATA
ncbi:GGDEF domain-containing protein [Noviherbaspirillum cavernae]|uniref:diguanylate cyclase n=2 Tax=Noviherbaspirillum cavernae TaxID=2320862 RepID=A0A418X6G2_9BURK|nr:GGDEF domain-containing protein [Noviherbaspirillum cavernae]